MILDTPYYEFLKTFSCTCNASNGEQIIGDSFASLGNRSMYIDRVIKNRGQFNYYLLNSIIFFNEICDV